MHDNNYGVSIYEMHKTHATYYYIGAFIHRCCSTWNYMVMNTYEMNS